MPITQLQWWGSGSGPNSVPGLYTLNKEIYLKLNWMNILENLKSFLFCIRTFGVRRPLLALESWIRSELYLIRAGFVDQGHQYNV